MAVPDSAVMIRYLFTTVTLITLCSGVIVQPSAQKFPVQPQEENIDSPDGYYAFMLAPRANPPQVKPPPYVESPALCPGVNQDYSPGKSLRNLCGDLNRGYIPQNPMKQNINGAPYPFELLKNKTLEFFSKTLPILKGDETLPKVIKYHSENQNFHASSPQGSNRVKRSEGTKPDPSVFLREIISSPSDLLNITRRHARKFCENGGGMICMLYKAIQGEPLGSGLMERRDDMPEYRRVDMPPSEGPPTPCPAKVEYATPVFARNYQGIWRYVVQIPYEGYFTQTVEVTKCVGEKCHYLDGKCLSSPRWVSLLVAEVYYPEANNTTSPPGQGKNGDESGYHLHKREVQPMHCDGHDQKGCFQVRLYYDWFLVPGSCKCWKPNYLHKFLR